MNISRFKKKQRDVIITVAEYAQFMTACKNGNLDDVKKFIKKGADVNHVYLAGLTPLMVACSAQNLSIVKYLFKKGADVNAKDNLGDTPLIKACMQNALDIIKFLVEKKADVNAENKQKNTPLHFVCSSFNEKFIYAIVPWLVKYGANLDAVNALGKKPSYYLDRPGQINSGFKEGKITRSFDREKLANYFDDTFLKFKMISSPGDDSTLNVLPGDVMNEIKERFIRVSEQSPDVQEVLEQKYR